jgi:hypothetical protein
MSNVLELVNEKIRLIPSNDKNFAFAQNIAEKIQKLMEITSNQAPPNNNAPLNSKTLVATTYTTKNPPVPKNDHSQQNIHPTVG